MKYRIIYNLEGGSANANIIWGNKSNEKNNIVLNKSLAYETETKKKINYKYYNCNLSINPFKCTVLDQIPSKVDLWAYDEVDLTWLNKGFIGMDNPSNICYFNSFIQCIFFTYPLIYHINLYDTDRISSQFFKNFVNHKFKDMNPERPFISVQDIDELHYKSYLKQFQDLNIIFNNINDQQDADEYFKQFLIFLDDNFYLENNKLIDNYLSEIFDIFNSVEYKDKDKKLNKNNIMNIVQNNNQKIGLSMYYFGLFIIDHVKLLNTNINNTITYYLEPQMEKCFILELYNKGTGTQFTRLDECLLNYFSENINEDEDKKYSDNYIGYKFYSHHMKLFCLPKILVIQLIRNKITRPGTKKKKKMRVKKKYCMV